MSNRLVVRKDKSDSDSDSDSSSDEQHVHHKHRHRAHGTMSPAMMANTAAVASLAGTSASATAPASAAPLPTRYVVRPAERDNKVDVIANYTQQPSDKPQFTEHKVEQRFNIDIPVTELEKMGDRIPFNTENGFLTKDDFIYSTTLDSTSDDLDFPTSVEVRLDHDTNMGLKITTAMRALETERGMADPSTVSTENPWGLIQLTVPRGSNTARYDRKVTPQQLNYMAAYPGQTANNVANWLLFPPKSNTALMVMTPLPAIAPHYNALVEEKNRKLGSTQYKPIDLDNIKSIVDTQGNIYVDKELSIEALKNTETAHKAKLNYCNFTNEKQLGFSLVTDSTKTVKNGRVTQTATRFSDAIRQTEDYAKVRAKDPGHAEWLVKNSKHSFNGTMSYTFIRADKNFVLSPVKE